MRRDPRLVDPRNDDEAEDRPGVRAWGIVLGVWAAFFAFLAIVVMPMLFGQCGTR